uniref:Uncharacterized protein n=1 Tax=Meloidogyne enterolobii TaxID=390850 RepID=A0A6V7UBV8_MELEN|nr:unnamed protein product [Meloidogyne enterolobii]
MPALDNVNEDGTNKSETKTPGKSASVGPATPNMPKADDSVAATGRTLRSSTTSAIVHQLVMLLICLLKRCLPQQQSLFVQVWKMALKHQHLHQDKSLRDVPNEHWTATN